jgi:hypothetical protein
VELYGLFLEKHFGNRPFVGPRSWEDNIKMDLGE